MERIDVCFELKMPKIGSWNGKWSGEGKNYYLFKSVGATQADTLLQQGTWSYAFGDGWDASITVTRVTEKQRVTKEKQNSGFAGYDWMVEEIINKGRILSFEERQKKLYGK